MKSGVGVQGGGEIFFLEVAKVYEGVPAPTLDYNEQGQQGEEQQVHWHMVADGVWRTKRFGAIMDVYSRQDKGPQGRYHQDSPNIVDGNISRPFHNLLGLVLQQGIAVL